MPSSNLIFLKWKTPFSKAKDFIKNIIFEVVFHNNVDIIMSSIVF